MQGAHRKLYVIIEDSLRNLSRWWKAPFNEVFLDGLLRTHRTKPANDVIENLFNYRAANSVYIKFQKFEVNDGDETGDLSSIRFDAVVFDAVDNLKSIEWMQTSGQNADKLLQ